MRVKPEKMCIDSCWREETPETFNGIRPAYQHTMQFMKCESVDEILIPRVNAIGLPRSAELPNRIWRQ